MAVPTTINIERKRGDTRRIIFKVKAKDTGLAIDLTGWTGFLLTVDPSKSPVDALNNIGQITGVVIGAATDGRVGFSPPGTFPIGNYFYDAQALDANTEKVTFAEGKYKVIQDITKD